MCDRIWAARAEWMGEGERGTTIHENEKKYFFKRCNVYNENEKQDIYELRIKLPKIL